MSNDWKKEPIDIDYLLNSGLLFRINRDLLHPLGIAITVRVDEQGSKHWDFKDERETPEATVFNEASYVKSEKKFKKFMEEFGSNQMDHRRRVFGQACQTRADFQRMR